MRAPILLVPLLAVVGCYKQDGGDGVIAGTGSTLDRPGTVEAGVGGPADEITRLKGKWTGAVLLGDVGAKVVMEFRDDVVVIQLNKATLTHPYRIDATKSPKWIDLKPAVEDPRPLPASQGVYELDGDQLTITTGYHGRPRQKQRDMGPFNVYRLKRVKD